MENVFDRPGYKVAWHNDESPTDPADYLPPADEMRAAERAADKARDKLRGLIGRFEDVIPAQTKTRRDGTTYETPEYQCIALGNGQNIVVERYNVISRDDDGDFWFDPDCPISELHLRNDAAEWSGPSVHIYEPELDWRFRRSDEGAELEWPIKNARVTHSSYSGTETPDGVRAVAKMLILAAELAELVDIASLPALLRQRALRMARSVDSDRKREVEEARKQENVDRVTSALDNDVPVARIRVRGKKTPVTGEVVKNNTYGLDIDVSYKTELEHVSWHNIEAIEAKNDKGRYERIELVPKEES